MSEKRYTVTLEEDPETGDLILPLPEQLLKEAGWETGDVLNWHDNKDGTFTMTKKQETQWVMVEAVSTFRHRYMVEVPVGIDRYGKDKSEWALDTVTMGEAKEFSQKHLGEQIVSHRIITKDEALSLCDVDNDYSKSWDEETKINNFFTKWEEQDGNTD